MIDRLREWMFPVVLLLFWTIAVGFTLYALAGLERSLESTRAASQSAYVVAKPTAHPGPAS